MDKIPSAQWIQIAEFEFWNLFLHPNQCYLGRTYLWAKRPDAVDFIDMNADEWKEFKDLGQAIKISTIKAFSPDMFNYAALGNIARHLHIHFIPRYAKPRIFRGIEFVDRRWGENYAPYDKNFTVSPNIKKEIALLIENKLSS